MMNKLKMMETKKLFKELEYFELDLEYKNQIVSVADSEFIRSVNEFLDANQDMKELFDMKINSKIEETLNKAQDSDVPPAPEEVPEKTEEEILKSKKIKKFYREIAKLTHPDKVSDEESKDLYLKATRYYEENDLIAMYSVCAELRIDFELEDSDFELIKVKIAGIKDRIEFMEKTFTWKWYHTDDEEERNGLVVGYVKSKIGK